MTAFDREPAMPPSPLRKLAMTAFYCAECDGLAWADDPDTHNGALFSFGSMLAIEPDLYVDKNVCGDRKHDSPRGDWTISVSFTPTPKDNGAKE